MVAENDTGPKPLAGRLRLERVPWDSLCENHYKRIPMDSPTEHADGLAQRVKAGKAQSWLLFNAAGKDIGLAITEIEANKAKEFVICAVFAESEFPISLELNDQLERIARSQGCISMRFHTCRHALARYAVEFGKYRLCEVIMRQDLT